MCMGSQRPEQAAIHPVKVQKERSLAKWTLSPAASNAAHVLPLAAALSGHNVALAAKPRSHLQDMAACCGGMPHSHLLPLCCQGQCQLLGLLVLQCLAMPGDVTNLWAASAAADSKRPCEP